MTAIEKLAREHDALLAEYDRLLRLVGEVAAGRVVPTRLSVDLGARSWSLAPDEAARLQSVSENGEGV